jgi:hypothetical protein
LFTVSQVSVLQDRLVFAEQSTTHYVGQEEERHNAYAGWIYPFALLIPYGPPSYGMFLPIFSASLPSLVYLL